MTFGPVTFDLGKGRLNGYESRRWRAGYSPVRRCAFFKTARRSGKAGLPILSKTAGAGFLRLIAKTRKGRGGQHRRVRDEFQAVPSGRL